MRLSDAVIDEINNIKGFKTTSGELILEEKAELITKIVNRLLHEVTADPDTVSRPKGHWTNVSISVSGDSTADCSRCGATVHNSFADTINYCPNCGADMRQQEGSAV